MANSSSLLLFRHATITERLGVSQRSGSLDGLLSLRESGIFTLPGLNQGTVCRENRMKGYSNKTFTISFPTNQTVIKRGNFINEKFIPQGLPVLITC